MKEELEKAMVTADLMNDAFGLGTGEGESFDELVRQRLKLGCYVIHNKVTQLGVIPLQH